MSGKKIEDVNGQLSKCEEAWKASEKNWKNRIAGGIAGIKENQKKIQDCYVQIRQGAMSLSEECQREFPEESREIERQWKELQKKKCGDYTGDIAQAESEEEKIRKGLREADRENESIRQSIKGRSWYLDPEFERAEKLAEKYRKLAKERDKTIRALDDAAGKSSLECATFQSAARQAKNLLEKRKQLEEKARKIAELRKEAGEAREFLKKSIEEIDAVIAEKFMAEEFDGLKKEICRAAAMEDGEFVRSLASMSERIGVFRAALDMRYAAFTEEQQKTEAGIKQLKDLLEADGYYEPTDYLRNGEQAKKNSLLRYIRKYGDRDGLVSEIEEGMREAEAAFQDEAFSRAQDLLKGTDEKIHQAMEYAAMVQENMLKSAYIAVDIRKVMKDFEYNVSAAMIDGNPKNGWKIVAARGGETINFERVYVDEAGKSEIGIDHKIRPGAFCHKEWEEISRAMTEKGIFVEGVRREDGTAVVGKPKKPEPGPVNPKPGHSPG